MTAFLVNVADLQKHTQVELEKVMKTYQVVTVKAQKEKKAIEEQFVILNNEKTALNTALEEAKAARDEAIAMADSLRSE